MKKITRYERLKEEYFSKLEDIKRQEDLLNYCNLEYHDTIAYALIAERERLSILQKEIDNELLRIQSGVEDEKPNRLSMIWDRIRWGIY